MKNAFNYQQPDNLQVQTWLTIIIVLPYNML